jgi:hypothetical protein
MARSLLLAGTVLAAAALVTVGGCGDDEAPEPAEAAMADAASVSTSSGGGAGAGGPRVNFGRACERAEDCGVGLLCLTADSRALIKGGPPRGLCTASCDQDPQACAEYADGARCVQFGMRAYCVEACEYGSPLMHAFDREKCHGRTEFACKPTLVDTQVACEEDADCGSGERCDGTCHAELPTCMPQCNSGADCDSDSFCDPETGECVRDLPRGLALGEPCDAEAEPDACRGSCGLLQRAGGDRCDETCTIGAFPACGQDQDPTNFGCAIPIVGEAAFGDMGYCAPLCDCTADCPSGLQCVVASFVYLQRPGFCTLPKAGDAIRSYCGTDSTSTGGTGGTGGVSATSAGTGGTTGTDATGGSDASGGTGQGGEAGALGEGGAAGALGAGEGALFRW